MLPARSALRRFALVPSRRDPDFGSLTGELRKCRRKYTGCGTRERAKPDRSNRRGAVVGEFAFRLGHCPQREGAVSQEHFTPHG